MCSRLTRLCCDLVEEQFGPIVAKVASFIIQNGFSSLRSITQQTKLKSDLVRKSLCVLIQHKLVRFRLYKGKLIEYECNTERIAKLAIYPKMIYTAKLLYGDVAELIVEEVLHHGIILMSAVIQRVTTRLCDAENDTEIRNKARTAFDQLVNTHFLMREPCLVEDDDEVNPVMPVFQTQEKDMFAIPVVSDKSLKRRLSDSSESQPQAKRLKTEQEGTSSSSVSAEEAPEDAGIYWSVNVQRFDQYFRDQGIVAAISHRFGASSGEVFRSMLRISEVTTSASAARTEPISSAEVSRNLPIETQIPVKHIDQYLRLIANDDSRLVEQTDEGGDMGAYVINLKRCAKAMATGTILSYVQERFGSKCCRIYRLLLVKQHLEQKQVEELAMIPSKEAKGHLYQMLADNMLVMQEIPRTPDHAPSRTFYLFAVNLQRVARMLLARSYQIKSNLMQRRKSLAAKNKRLLDKKARVAAIKESLHDPDPVQLEEIDEMISPNEKSQLAKYDHCNDKLVTAESQVMDTVLTLQIFIQSLLGDKILKAK